jgi:hypothetical protein
MNDNRNPASRCRELNVSVEVCRLRFSKGRVQNSTIVGYTTRGEMVVAHFDSDDRILDIELVGDGKPCQEPESRLESTPTNGTVM